MTIPDLAVDPNDSCFGVTSEKCDVLSISLATNESLTPPIPPSCDPGYYPDLVLTPEEEARRQDPLVFNQTEKLARFMLGLIDDENSDGGPNLRLIKLLKLSFKIFKKFVSSAFIQTEFSNDVLRAFLFLFRESELTNFKDIPVAEYYMIDKMLRKCENMQAPFKLIGIPLQKNFTSVCYKLLRLLMTIYLVQVEDAEPVLM